ncbi:hypothetical protein [Pseudanabaena yagii]|uniref:Uncharacterized protein n=1 Tax=Pseudanabaena yagii GIHE-NHR1 TaxID=2722753 RepID=A0ABX1LSZ6_9CYAN|nr:hypothetical protein [Pseudanabaena yagii]NMF58155.1 hypothetical protein [Pseudanabaena yagii GIHE-NHR1]
MDNWSVYVVDGFDSTSTSSVHRAQPSGDRIQSLRDRNKSSSLSGVEGTVNEAEKSPPRG